MCNASLVIRHLPLFLGSKRLQQVAMEPLTLVKQKEVRVIVFAGAVCGGVQLMGVMMRVRVRCRGRQLGRRSTN